MQLLHEMGIVAMLSLLVALVPVVMAAGYAIWPTESKLSLMRPLSLASIFAGLGGFVVGTMNTIKMVVTESAGVPSSSALVGLCESLVPLAVAFGSLTVAWLLVALGLRRQS